MKLFSTSGILLLLVWLIPCISSCNKEKQRRKIPVHQISNKARKTADQEKIRQLSAYFKNFQQKTGYSGAILIGQDDQILYEQASGYADFGTKRPNEGNTPFQLASVSKQFTAVAILLLKERGRLSLNDSIQKFFPDFPYHGISIKMLLQHRSGLPNYIYFCDEYINDKSHMISNSFVMSLMTIGKPPPYYPPDICFDYSNTGYMVLASIVERVSRMPFADFLRVNIFEPLKMNDAFLVNQKDTTSIRAANGYQYRKRPLAVVFLDGVLGDKGIYASVEDLFKWDQALYDGKLLKPETLEDAFLPLSRKSTARHNYGYGWRVYFREDSLKILYHAGWWQGFESMLVRIPEKRTTMVFLKNTKSGPLPDRDSLINLLY